MEKPLKDLSALTNYQNRQVILNYYQDEDLLYERDCFHFVSIQLTETALTFIKSGGISFTIELKDYPQVYINTDFPNYYTLKNNQNLLEIYFP
jgi:hypothetical protein